MLKVGITGGIGSGKSLVTKIFILFGIPVFNADERAKYLMEHDATLKNHLKKTFGNEIYKSDRLDRSLLASLVFQYPKKLNQLNQLVHPATIAYSKRWIAQQDAPYIIKEAALFFESGSNVEMDKMIGVYAPKALRLKRSIKRDGVSEQDILSRMAQQMGEEEKMKRCDFIIFNDESKSVLEQVLFIHQNLISKPLI